jgi:hypothetical protein
MSSPRDESAARRVSRVAAAQVASLFFAEGYLAEWATAGALLGVNYGVGGKRTPVTLRDTTTRPVADPDLLHPYRPNSVSGAVLFVLCFAVPAALVLASNAASAADVSAPSSFACSCCVISSIAAPGERGFGPPATWHAQAGPPGQRKRNRTTRTALPCRTNRRA